MSVLYILKPISLSHSPPSSLFLPYTHTHTLSLSAMMTAPVFLEMPSELLQWWHPLGGSWLWFDMLFFVIWLATTARLGLTFFLAICTVTQHELEVTGWHPQGSHLRGEGSLSYSRPLQPQRELSSGLPPFWISVSQFQRKWLQWQWHIPT